jgi:hypothetical protein
VEVLAVVLGALVVVAGWFVSQAQARRAVRRNIRIEYLITAYRTLEGLSFRPVDPGTPAARELEIAVGNIQLLGSASQVRLVRQAAQSWASSNNADLEALLNDLQSTLRKELLLEAVPAGRTILRINPPEQDSTGVPT